MRHRVFPVTPFFRLRIAHPAENGCRMLVTIPFRFQPLGSDAQLDKLIHGGFRSFLRERKLAGLRYRILSETRITVCLISGPVSVLWVGMRDIRVHPLGYTCCTPGSVSY